jgi:hypothetical protein
MSRTSIKYEFDSKPEIGETMPIADGIHWLRMPLPFSLGHINLWLLEDNGRRYTLAPGPCWLCRLANRRVRHRFVDDAR